MCILILGFPAVQEGKALLEEYAQIFEEEYNDLIVREKYKSLRDVNVAATDVHDGYFATDKTERKFKIRLKQVKVMRQLIKLL